MYHALELVKTLGPQLDLDQHGRITQVRGDERLYETARAGLSAPPLDAVLGYTSKENLRADGTPADISGKTPVEGPVWYLDADGGPTYRLRRPDTYTLITVRAEPGGDHSAYVEILAGEMQDALECALLALAREPAYASCVVSLEDDDTTYLGETATVTAGARALRLMREDFISTVTAKPLPED
jgi:hypothetical protein